MATATPSEDYTEDKSSTKGHRYVCPICLESLKTPRSLPCLHTFCEDCLQTFITSAVGNQQQGISCPVCRKQIMAPESGLPYDKWAKSFPINYYLSAQTEVHSDIKTEIENCVFCERSSKITPAEHFCKNCTEAICDACKNFHQNVPSLKNHNILTLEYYKKNPIIPEMDEICPYHPSKVIEVYCSDHSKMCCSVCFATKHRHCKDVKAIEECAEDLPEGVIKDISTKLESLLKSVEEEIKGKEKIGEKRMKCKEEIVVKMTQCVEAAKKNLDILLKKFESDVDNHDSSAESQLQNILKILQGIKTSVVGDMQMLETANEFGSKTQVFVALEKAKTQMNEQLKQISDVASGSLSDGYTVGLEKVEEVCKLKSIGNVHSLMSTSSAVTLGTLDIMESFINDADFQRKQRLIHLEPHKIKWVEKWTYKLPGTYYGATVFGKKVAVVTEEKKIVVFSRAGEKLFEHSIPYDEVPTGISSSHENKVYISFKGHKILKEYEIDNNKITEVNQISLQGVAEGFCIFDDQIVHTSGEYVYISNKNGQLINSLPMIISSGYIAFLVGCQRQRMFYHINDKNVICRRLDKDTTTKILLSEFTESPRGLGIDFQNNVYVCCRRGNKLLQISHKDHSVRVALEVDCYTIAFHPDGMSFVLIDYDGNLRFYTISE
ncbi:hypothetical protein FSP39_010707 [Pinctada imbricata]|uniref:Uncharacterized protein n=1 Tax=Pinctada imbricata TaxID=66713 RepID=A0AA88XW88_PINIB|nr:hypothetical protein FSP39_010707 [Pinctada imbricata]